MLSLLNVSKFLENRKEVKTFKYWAELLIDMLLLGSFLVMLLSWTMVVYKDTAELVCVLAYDNETDIALSSARYLSSRCLLQSDAQYVLLLPKMMFSEFLAILLCHTMWHYIPHVKSKLIHFREIFEAIGHLQPKFDFLANEILGSITLTDENCDEVNIIHDKLVFLVMERNSIYTAFIAKNVATFLLVVFISYFNVALFNILRRKSSYFECLLAVGENMKVVIQTSCTCSIFLPVVVCLFFFQLLVFAVLVLTVYNFIFIRSIHDKKSIPHSVFGANEGRFSGSPGYTDLLLYLTIHNSNIKDGGFLIKMVGAVVEQHVDACSNFIPVGGKKGKLVSSSPAIEDFKHQLAIINSLAIRLAMRVELKPYRIDHLYYCLCEAKTKGAVSHALCIEMKRRLLEEISANPFYYSYLLKGKTGKNLTEVSQILDQLRSYTEELRENRAWPNNILLAAAANVLHTKVVVLKSGELSDVYANRVELFEPYSSSWDGSVTFLYLILPRYYNILHSERNPSELAISTRSLLTSSSSYRHRLINAMDRKTSNLEVEGKDRIGQMLMTLRPHQVLSWHPKREKIVNHNVPLHKATKDDMNLTSRRKVSWETGPAVRDTKSRTEESSPPSTPVEKIFTETTT